VPSLPLPGTHHSQVLQTSSPSYLLLASLDAARYEAVQTTAWVSAWTTSLKARRALEKISGLVLLDDAHVAASESVGGFDPLRVVVNVADLGLTGYEAAKWLEEAWGVVPEMSTLNVSFLVTVCPCFLVTLQVLCGTVRRHAMVCAPQDLLAG
jgi:arginine/lysine/ornithine decarboxylase